MIRLSKSKIGPREKAAVQKVLDSEYLGMGAEVGKFEEELSEFFGRETACVVNGTSALQLALFGAGVSPGDEVLVQSLTYVACYQAIAALGAKPVACDILSDSFSIDLNDAEGRITSKTVAIMPVHYGGHAQDLQAIYGFANRFGLRVIEDSAHAFGSLHNGSRLGSTGDISCFSFDGIKNITSGEGGCVVSGDAIVMRKLKEARLLGVVGDSERRVKRQRSWTFDVENLGWRHHMSDIMAAIGREQLRRLPEFAEVRRKAASRYVEALQGVAKLKPMFTAYDNCVPHIFPILLDADVNREQLRAELLSEGIETGVHYVPCHQLSFFEAISDRLLTLPLHADIKIRDVVFIVDRLANLLKAH